MYSVWKRCIIWSYCQQWEGPSYSSSANNLPNSCPSPCLPLWSPSLPLSLLLPCPDLTLSLPISLVPSLCSHLSIPISPFPSLCFHLSVPISLFLSIFSKVTVPISLFPSIYSIPALYSHLFIPISLFLSLYSHVTEHWSYLSTRIPISLFPSLYLYSFISTPISLFPSLSLNLCPFSLFPSTIPISLFSPPPFSTPAYLSLYPRIREHTGSVVGGRVPATQGSSGPCVYCRKPGVRSLYCILMLPASLGKVVHTVKRAGTYAAKVPPEELHKIAVHVRAVSLPLPFFRLCHTHPL